MIPLEPNAPRTMLILGAAISGGDAMGLAKKLCEADEDTGKSSVNHNQRRKQMSDTSSIKTMIDAINEQCDESFHILAEPTNDEFLSLFNGDDLITEDWDYEVEDRLKQIVKENQVQIDWPKDHLQSMNTVEDIIEHDPLGLLDD